MISITASTALVTVTEGVIVQDDNFPVTLLYLACYFFFELALKV